MLHVKNLPNEKDFEMLVIGAMLANKDNFDIAIRTLEDFDFFYSEHKIIFNVLKSLHGRGLPAEIHLICNELKDQQRLESLGGGVAYLTSLAQTGFNVHIEYYIDQLKKISRQRQLINLAKDIEKRAFDKEDPNSIAIDALEKIKQVERHKSVKEKIPIQFLDERSENFLLKLPPKKPMLLEITKSNGEPQGFLPKSIVAMLVGAGGVGKTHLLAQLAISIATGGDWLGSFSTTQHCGDQKKGNVFLGLGENQEDDIHRILYKASKHLRKTQGLLFDKTLEEASKRICAFSFCGQQAAFLEKNKPSHYFRHLKMRLEDKAPIGGWSLIILDPISRFLGADAEIDNASATQFIALLEELTIDLPGNPTVLFAHHMSKAAIKNTHENKTDQTAARGSSALTDGVRWQLNAFKGLNPDDMILSLQKSNFTAINEPIYLKKDFEGFLVRYLPELTSESPNPKHESKKADTVSVKFKKLSLSEQFLK
ncbi:MAG: hypothetical protein CK425_11255 [Parachlamydia sp.]|nr:MAG: hypothetical protein CK425_11255 [Parachlamydia sp.]